MNTTAPPTTWSLEVVRGRDVGRRYALPTGELALGNAPGGLDLAEQEAGSARRMAPRQALIVNAAEGPTLADLDSPGGTFVNRQRLLGGQLRRLAEGDVIQVAGVQLKVVRVASVPIPVPSPPAEKPSGFAFALRSGTVCRTWDDFLAVSAQRWGDLRDELTAGRLAGYLQSIGRSDRAPSPTAPGSPDERLDAWLASLPTTKPSLPEIEVHPPSLSLRLAPGGGTTLCKIRVANAGYRLLRATARVEPPTVGWLRVAAEQRGRPILAVESAEVSIEVDGPEVGSGRQSASLVFEGNGGMARVEVTREPSMAVEAAPTAAQAAAIGPGLASRLSGVSPARRLATAAIALAAGRLALAILGRFVDPASPTASLRAASLLLATLGGIGGLIWAGRRGSVADAPFGAVSGAIAGTLAAAVAVAACRSVEPLLGSTLSASMLAVVPLWGAAGAGLAWASSRLVPYRGVKA